jgi:DNA-binding transcriptional MocR family regulator
MFLPVIDKRKPGSIFRQILNQIIQKIESGAIIDGYQMPPSRELARMLGVNRSTVVKVYEELWALGYVESTPGSYTRVRKRVPLAKITIRDEPQDSVGQSDFPAGLLNSDLYIDPAAYLSVSETTGYIDLQRLVPDTRLIDHKLIQQCFRDVINDPETDPFGYCDIRGFVPLRQNILKHMNLHGIHASDENILMTSGSQNALHLVFQALVSKEDIVVVESPTYSMVIPLLRLMRCKVLEVPVEEDGMDTQILERIFKRHKVKLVYCMPTFHNPTGITMTQEKREALLQICEQYQTLIVEDGFEEEMKYFGKVHLPIKSMDRIGNVIYLGSFSKIFAPGMRTGWIIAHPEIIRKLTNLKTTFDLSSNTMSQAILHQFCQRGGYELHIRKLMRVYRKRMKKALKALKKYIPHGKASWNEPLGGFLIWLQIHSIKKDEDMEKRLRETGVSVGLGKSFFYTEQKGKFIRISISASDEETIIEGIRRLGSALQSL